MQVTLQTAILSTVQQFISENKSFSLHDITKSIRDDVNNETFVLNDSPELIDFNSDDLVPSKDIRHTRVKALFQDMWTAGLFSDGTWELNVESNGTYRVYTPVAAVGVVKLNPRDNTSTNGNPTLVKAESFADLLAKLSGNASFNSTNSGNVVASPQSSKSVPKNSQLFETILNYIANSVGDSFTIKQLQSALKRDNYTNRTCQELSDFINANLNEFNSRGFKVNIIPAQFPLMGVSNATVNYFSSNVFVD